VAKQTMEQFFKTANKSVRTTDAQDAADATRGRAVALKCTDAMATVAADKARHHQEFVAQSNSGAEYMRAIVDALPSQAAVMAVDIDSAALTAGATAAYQKANPPNASANGLRPGSNDPPYKRP
jgi:hypothetical protein